MRNYFTGKQTTTPNRNVPDNAELIGRVSYMSGEIQYDYYCLRYDPPHPEYGHWALWKVGDWIYNKPQLVNWNEIKSLIIERKDNKNGLSTRKRLSI